MNLIAYYDACQNAIDMHLLNSFQAPWKLCGGNINYSHLLFSELV